MQSASRMTQISALALGIAGALAFGQTHASGFQLKENSVKATGRAYAGSGAASGDVSVVINNPAAMSTFTERAVQADVHAIDLSYEVDATGTDAFGRPLTGGDGGNAGGVAAVPALSAIFPMGDSGVTIGASINAPFGLATEYDNDWVGRYHAVESDVKIVDFNLAASFAITDRLSVGASVIYQHAEVTLSNAIDFGTALCAPNPTACFAPTSPFFPQRNDGFAEINGDDNGFGYSVGLHWRPTDNLAVGLSHRSEIDHELRGEADFDVPANVAAVLGVVRPGQFVDTGVTAGLTTPSVTTLSGVWQATEAFSLMADVSKTGWTSLRTIDIDYDSNQPNTIEVFDWQGTVMLSLGGEYKLSDALTLRAGVARDEAPVSTEHRTPRLPDNDRTWYSAGVTWAASDALEISGAFTRIQVEDPEMDIVSSSGSRLVGDAQGHANIFGISAQYKF